MMELLLQIAVPIAAVFITAGGLYLQIRKQGNDIAAWRGATDARLSALEDRVERVSENAQKHEDHCQTRQATLHTKIDKGFERIHERIDAFLQQLMSK